MEPYRYLQRVGEQLDELQDPQRIEPLLGELELLHEALESELQHPADDLIERLSGRLRRLRAR